MSARKAIPLFWAGSLLVLSSTAAFGQSQTTGRITGTVKDQNGAVIVGANVTITSNATGEERKVITDNEGNYTVPLLMPGRYRVRVAANGFAARVFDPVQVVITETNTVDGELAVASLLADPVT